MDTAPPSVVFDCNLYVQSLLNPDGAAAKCRRLDLDDEVVLFVSPQIVAEIHGVLRRPNIRKLAPALTDDQVDAFLEEILQKAVLLQNVPEEFRYERDPDDEPYINLAIVARVSYIVSRDNDLLDLMKPDDLVGQIFRRRYPMLKIFDPATFLKSINK